MAYYDNTWYVNGGDQLTTGHWALPKRAPSTAYVVGQIVRQFTAPAVASERAFICIVAGTTSVAVDATWTLTRGTKSAVDGTVTWMEITGMAAVNGDAVNTPTWDAMRIASTLGAITPSLGVIIKRNNGASYQICTTAGTIGATEPAFSDTPGVNTTETAGTNVWTCIGPVIGWPTIKAPMARISHVNGTNWAAAGHTVFIANIHNENQSAGITISVQALPQLVTKFLCHNAAGNYPPTSADMTTGAIISTSGNFGITIQPATQGGIFFSGISFRAGVVSGGNSCSITVSGSQSWVFYDACSFELWANATNPVVAFQLTTNAGWIQLNNTKVKFGHLNNGINLSGGQLLWQNTEPFLVAGSLIPTSLFRFTNDQMGVSVLEAIDLSQINTGLVASGNIASSHHFTLRDCKLNAAATLATSSALSTIQLIRSSA